MSLGKIIYIYKNWKVGFHLLFRTKRFGVNNEWWSQFDSLFGAKTFKDRISLRRNYMMIKLRAKLGSLPEDQYEMLFGEKK